MNPKHNATFPLEDVLSVVTGKLCGKIGGVYEVLSFFEGRPVFTHELPKLMPLTCEKILKQYPELTKVTTDDLDKRNYTQWLKKAVESLNSSSLILRREG